MSIKMCTVGLFYILIRCKNLKKPRLPKPSYLKTDFTTEKIWICKMFDFGILVYSSNLQIYKQT